MKWQQICFGFGYMYACLRDWVVCLGYVPPPDQIETQAYDGDLIAGKICKQDSFASDATTLILGRSDTTLTVSSEDTQLYEGLEAEHTSPSKQLPPTYSLEAGTETSTAAEPGNVAESTADSRTFSVLDYKAGSL